MKKFVKLLSGPRLIGARVYPAGSVLEVDETLASYLVKDKVAEASNGPVSEPAPAPDDPAPAVDPARKSKGKSEAVA